MMNNPNKIFSDLLSLHVESSNDQQNNATKNNEAILCKNESLTSEATHQADFTDEYPSELFESIEDFLDENNLFIASPESVRKSYKCCFVKQLNTQSVQNIFKNLIQKEVPNLSSSEVSLANSFLMCSTENPFVKKIGVSMLLQRRMK